MLIPPPFAINAPEHRKFPSERWRKSAATPSYAPPRGVAYNGSFGFAPATTMFDRTCHGASDSGLACVGFDLKTASGSCAPAEAAILSDSKRTERNGLMGSPPERWERRRQPLR